MITINSDRPNIVRGRTRLIQPRGSISRRRQTSASASSGGSIEAGGAAAAGSASIRLEDIAGSAHDLAPQPRHLNIDIAHIAAELRRQRQFLARYRLAGPLRQPDEQRGFSGGQVNRLAAAKQLAAREIEPAAAKTNLAPQGLGRWAALQQVADAQHQFARLERL